MPVLKRIVRYLGSMRAGLALLVLVTVVSAFAALQEQAEVRQNIYGSWWFAGIIAFSALNLLFCSVRRLGPLCRLAYRPPVVRSAADLRKMPLHTSVKLGDVPDRAAAAPALAAAAFRAAGLRVSGEERGIVFGERDRAGYFGSVFTHFGLLIILLGVMIGALSGFEHINGGIAGSSFFVEEGGFTVAVQEVRMVQEDDPAIRPRVYSDVTVTQKGREIASGTVAINEPLRFGGNAIYHTTFRYVSALTIKDTASGRQKTEKYWDEDKLRLGEEGNFLYLVRFYPNFSLNTEGIPYSKNYLPENPVLAGILFLDNRPVHNVYLHLNRTETIETKDNVFELTMIGFENAVVYTVSRNLGRPLLATGAVVLVGGLVLCFAFSPRRFWAAYEENTGEMIIGGQSYRNRYSLEQTLDKITAAIGGREEE